MACSGVASGRCNSTCSATPSTVCMIVLNSAFLSALPKSSQSSYWPHGSSNVGFVRGERRFRQREAWSEEHGGWSKEQGARSEERGARSKEQSGNEHSGEHRKRRAQGACGKSKV